MQAASNSRRKHQLLEVKTSLVHACSLAQLRNFRQSTNKRKRTTLSDGNHLEPVDDFDLEAQLQDLNFLPNLLLLGHVLLRARTLLLE